jgi:high affinity Mn2+ porin
MKGLLILGVSAMLFVGGAKADDLWLMAVRTPPPALSPAYDWSGFYAGWHLGVAWGNSNWTASTIGALMPSVSGSLNLFQPIDSFSETGSFFTGQQAGYDYLLPSRLLIGAEIDASFPSFRILAGISIGGTSTFSSQSLGPERYSETMLSFGTLRGRIGYPPGNWFLYATGGFAWAYDQLTLTQLASGTTQSPFFGDLAGRPGPASSPSGAALDGSARISVQRLWPQQFDLPGGDAAIQL